MTNPNIERDKVEEITPLYTKDECDADLAESMAILGTMSAKAPVAHAINIVNSMIQHLQSAITVSEKRAETAEQLAEDWQCEYDKVLEERDAERTESARAFATAAAALRERDEARAVSDSLAENLHELQADHVTCQSERDSARSSLMRVEDVLGFAEQWLSAFVAPPTLGQGADNWARGQKRVLERLRSALQASGDGGTA